MAFRGLRSALVGFGVVGASWAVAEDCSNGNACLAGQTCVSTAARAGRRFGCAPAPDAVVCNDARFSCPAGCACNLEEENCRLGGFGKAVPLLHNVDAFASHMLQSPQSGLLNKTLCEVVTPDLPAQCDCTDAHLGGVVHCSIGVLFSDHFGLNAEILPCDDVAHVDLQVTESKHNINYTITGVSEGKSENFPIPGLTIGIPKVGSADVDATLKIDGSLSKLQLKVGLNACATISGKKVCGSDLTSYLPFWVLHGSYHFSDICNSSSNSSSDASSHSASSSSYNSSSNLSSSILMV